MRLSAKKRKPWSLDPTTTSTLVPSGKSVSPSLRVVVHTCLGVSGAFGPVTFLLGLHYRRRRRPFGFASPSGLLPPLSRSPPCVLAPCCWLTPSCSFWFFSSYFPRGVASSPMSPGRVPPLVSPPAFAHLSPPMVLGPPAFALQRPVCGLPRAGLGPPPHPGQVLQHRLSCAPKLAVASSTVVVPRAPVSRPSGLAGNQIGHVGVERL